MIVVDQITGPGTAGKPNEDALGNAGNTAWVLDGASGAPGASPLIAAEGGTDAAWLSHFLSGRFHEHAENFGADLAAMLEHALDETIASFEKNARRKPSSVAEEPLTTVVLLRREADRVCALALSDSVLLIETPDGIKGLYGDESHRLIDEAETAKTIAYKKKHGVTLAEARVAMWKDSPGSRTIVNKENGFWVLGLSKEPLARTKKIETPLIPGTHALLLSDGLYRLVDVFEKYDDTSLLNAAKENGLQALYDELREIENNDPEADIYPRMKKSDDATGMLLRF